MNSKNILITGISSGIGRDAATTLASNGFNVYGTVRNQNDKTALENLNIQNLKIFIADITKPDDILAIKSELNNIPLAGLINNAGVAVSGPLKYLPIEKLKSQFETNVFSLFSVTQAFIPNLDLNKNFNGEAGRIVMISSISGRMVTPFTAPYAASKYAVEALSDGFIREMSHSGIKVCIIEPGPIKTEIWDKALNEDTSAFIGEYKSVLEFRSEYINQTIRGALDVKEVSKAILKALTYKNPPIRQVVTKYAWLIKMLWRLPDGLVDYFAKKKVKLNDI